MADVVTFDTVNLRIVEISAGGDNELDWLEIYSEWKDWLLADPSRLGFPPAFRVVGGDPISDVQNLGSTFFLLAPWKFRPSEEDHRLTINGNLFTDPAGESPFVPTLGTYTVLAESKVSNLVDASVARLDLSQLLNAVYIDTNTGDDAGSGTNTEPVQTLTRAYEIATTNNLTAYVFRGALTIDQDYQDWNFIGASELNSTIDFGGYDLNGSRLIKCGVSGTLQGRIELQEGRIDAVTDLDGVFRNCGVTGSFSTTDNAMLVLVDCFSEVAGTGTPTIDVGAGNDLNIRRWSGGLELQNIGAGTTASVDLAPGRLVLGNTNTGGAVLVRGGTQFDDTSAGTIVTDDGLLESLRANKAALAAALIAAK